jgi:hypothetical protein
MYEKAKAIIIKRPGESEIRNIRLAEVDEETIVVKTKYSGISIGTEMAVFNGKAGWEGVWESCQEFCVWLTSFLPNLKLKSCNISYLLASIFFIK